MRKRSGEKTGKRAARNTGFGERALQKVDMSERPLLSICMIVRNEERHLERCLRSVEGVSDDIIIVDTGSIDGTVPIAKKFTDKVYFHPWQNSFSEARNHYLQYARGKWILQIDADEELVREDIPTLLNAIQADGIDAVMVQIISRFHNGNSQAIHSVERIFRNNGVIHYEGRVHNRLTGIRNAKVFPIRLVHHGYDLPQEESRKKFVRTLSLLEMDLQDDPNNPLTYHYLGCLYIGQRMWREALDTSLRAIHLAEERKEGNAIYLWSHYNAAMACYRLKKPDRARNISLSALRKFPNHIDSHFLLGLIYFDQKEWKKLVEHGGEYLRLARTIRSCPEKFGNIVTNSLSEEWNILTLMGMGYFELGQPEKAGDLFERGIESAPDPFLPLRAVAIYFKSKMLPEMALPYLKRAQRINPDEIAVKELLQQLESHEKSEGGGPTISCCMIVKNEESFLERCLQSIKRYVNEIIIVDTGSEDRTLEIARRYTEKVYSHPWEGSFSKARNQALAYATCDWVFQIDADEELADGSGEKLIKAVREAGKADAVLVNIVSTYSKGNKKARHNFERLFRNNGTIHYEGIVHNRVVGATSVKPSKIELLHYGYDVEERKAREKFRRTTELLKRQIEESADDPMPHHYLGTSYLSRGMNQEAARESVLSIELAEKRQDNHPLYLWTHHNAAIAFFRMGDLEKAENYSYQAIAKYPKHLDSYFVLTLVAAERSEWEKVLPLGRKYLELMDFFDKNPDQAGLVINTTLKEGAGIHLVMGHAYHSRKDYEAMSAHYVKAYEMSEIKWQAWWNAATFHLDRSGDLERSRYYLHLALRESPDEPDVWYMLAKLNKKSGLPRKERNCLEKLFNLGSRDQMILSRLASLYMKDGDLEKAEEVLTRLIELDPANYRARCMVGRIYKEQKRPDRAIEAFNRALEIQPLECEPWLYLAEISIDMNRIEEGRAFLDRILSSRSSRPLTIKALILLCEIELREGRVLDFIGWCDLLLKELGVNRDVLIESMDDLVSILVEVYFTLAGDPDMVFHLRRLFHLLPVDLHSALSGRLETSKNGKGLDRAEFKRRALEELMDSLKAGPTPSR